MQLKIISHMESKGNHSSDEKRQRKRERGERGRDREREMDG
jgi:hypothetical protein